MFTLFRVVLVVACLLGMTSCNGAVKRLVPPSGSFFPPCKSPAPLTGKFDPNAPGFIVVLADSVDVAARVQDLSARYQFIPLNIFERLGMFYAELTAPVVAQLRCESLVRYIEYNGVVHASSLAAAEN